MDRLDQRRGFLVSATVHLILITLLSSREVLVFAPLLAMMVVMGLYPKPFLDRMEKSVTATLARAEAKRVADDARFRADRLTLDAQTVAVKTETSVVAQP